LRVLFESQDRAAKLTPAGREMARQDILETLKKPALATLAELRREGAYERLFANGRRLMSSLQRFLDDAGIPARVIGEPPAFQGGYFEFHGEFYDIERIKMAPVPSEPIPILIGGHSDPALRRAARTGDGWMHG